MMNNDDIMYFCILLNGNLNYVKFPGGITDCEMFVRYDVVCGPDWDLISGLTGAVSQITSVGSDPEKLHFNLPFEVLFRSSNITGWPQLVISVYGINKLGIEGIRGYGRIHIPTTIGEKSLKVPLLCPRSATTVGEWISWFTGKYPELKNPTIMADGSENHYLIRTHSHGLASLTVSIISKDLRKFGYDNSQA